MNKINLPPLKEKINNNLDPIKTPGDTQRNSAAHGPVSYDAEPEVITVNKNNPLVQFDIQRAALDKIKTYQSLKVDVDNPKSVKGVKDAKKITRDLRLKVQRREKALDAGLVKKRKALKSDAGAIIREIKETETYLVAEIKKDTDHKAKLAEEARLVEVARVEKLEKNMRILETHCESGLISGLTADQIQEKLNFLNTIEIPKDIFQEKYQSANDLLSHAIGSTIEKLADRKRFEDEEIKRAADMAALKRQEEINAQTSWFNSTFGWNSSLESMEKGLGLLGNSTFSDHLKDLAETQKLQAQDILVGARAKKAEQDRLDQEKADREAQEKAKNEWNEAHIMNKAWDEANAAVCADAINFELPENIKEVVDEVEEKEDRKPKHKKKEPRTEQRSFIEASIKSVKQESENLQSLITKNPYELTLYLSDKSGEPLPIMSGTDGLSPILNSIKAILADRLASFQR